MHDLHGGTAEQRLASFEKVIATQPMPTKRPEYCNNHVHTIYSFSPYSPTEAVYQAFLAGLNTVGIMDHDSVGGAREFLKAGSIAGLGVTVGAEVRVSIKNTRLGDKNTNNPDQSGVAYMALHGIPEQSLEAVEEFFKPICAARCRRNRAMVENINKITSSHNITINYDNDVVPLSMSHDGGSVTERHLLYALATKVYKTFGADGAAAFAEKIGCSISEAVKNKINSDPKDVLYILLGVFKSSLVGKIYVEATDELPDVKDLVRLCNDNGIVLAYPYLGDVGDSVTGDKKAQKFEDSFIEELFEELTELGIKAVTYMPARNTSEQLAMVQELCRKYNMFEISGEDINMPSQSFICEKLTDKQFSHLVDATYALIGHEKAAKTNLSDAMIYEDFADLDKVINKYKNIAIG